MWIIWASPTVRHSKIDVYMAGEMCHHASCLFIVKTPRFWKQPYCQGKAPKLRRGLLKKIDLYIMRRKEPHTWHTDFQTSPYKDICRGIGPQYYTDNGFRGPSTILLGTSNVRSKIKRCKSSYMALEPKANPTKCKLTTLAPKRSPTTHCVPTLSYLKLQILKDP